MVASASAGPDLAVSQGALVTLDGSASVGDAFEWTLLDDGGTGFDSTYLSGSLTDTAGFTAPYTAGTLTFRLKATESVAGAGEDPPTVTTDTDDVDVVVELEQAFYVAPAEPFITIESSPPRKDNLEVYALSMGGYEVLAQLTVVEGLTFEDRLNAPGALSLQIPNSPLPDGRPLQTVLEAGVHELQVVQFGKPVWTGPILTVNEEPLGAPGTVEINCEGLLAYAKRFFVWSYLEGATTTYTDNPDSEESFPPGRLVDVEQTEILRRLLDFQLNKAWGDMFNLANYTHVQATGVLRTRTYNPGEFPNVYEMMESLSNVIDGFDYAITADRELRTWYPHRGRRRLDKVFHNGNIVSLSRQVDATEQASRVLAVGAGEGPDQLRLKVVDWPARERYGPTNRVYSNTDVSNESTLEQQAYDELDAYKVPPQTFTMSVRSADAVGLEVGDSVRINYTSGYSAVDEWRRVVGIVYKPFEDVTELVVN